MKRREFLTLAAAAAAIPLVPAVASGATTAEEFKRRRQLAKVFNFNETYGTPIARLNSKYNVHVISSQPGCGKTTALKAIAKAWTDLDPDNLVIFVEAEGAKCAAPRVIQVTMDSPTMLDMPFKIFATSGLSPDKVLFLLDLPELWMNKYRGLANNFKAVKWAGKLTRTDCAVIRTTQLPREAGSSLAANMSKSHTTLFRWHGNRMMLDAETSLVDPESATVHNLIQSVFPLDLTQWHADHKGA